VRFLSDKERIALLDECRRSTWPQLYLLVMLAFTTGARKGNWKPYVGATLTSTAALPPLSKRRTATRVYYHWCQRC
jgi:hypothetical protein